MAPRQAHTRRPLLSWAVMVVAAAAGLLLLTADSAQAYQLRPPRSHAFRPLRMVPLPSSTASALARPLTTRRFASCRGDGDCEGCSCHHHHVPVEEQQQARGARGFLRRLPARVLGKVWRRRQHYVDGEEAGKAVSVSKLAGGLVLAAIGPNPWDRYGSS